MENPDLCSIYPMNLAPYANRCAIEPPVRRKIHANS
jgi:hypothetical protein